MKKINGKALSDALVLFGVTGDLASKMIFPALYAMAKRGLLDVPVIGVASSDWNMTQLRALGFPRIAGHLVKHIVDFQIVPG